MSSPGYGGMISPLVVLGQSSGDVARQTSVVTFGVGLADKDIDVGVARHPNDVDVDDRPRTMTQLLKCPGQGNQSGGPSGFAFEASNARLSATP